MSHDLSGSKRRIHKSRCNLELSEVQQVTSKTFRDEKANSDQVNYHREDLSERSCMCSKK